MPSSSREHQQAELRIEEHIKHFPYYVQEYVRAKKRAGLSPTTILEYLYDYKKFFDWLRQEGLADYKDNASIPYSVLEHLRKRDVEFFIDYLKEERIEERKGIWKNRSDARVNRYIQALKSLFNYLTKETEDDQGECYFYRNVLAKITTQKGKETAKRRARRINSVILSSDEINEFISFLKYEYEQALSTRERNMFLRNKERDVALISLMLGSGVRVSEVASLTLSDIDMSKNMIDVIRKGGKADSVNVLSSAMSDLNDYLSVRKVRYGASDSDIYVFLSRYKGKAQPISVRTIQNNLNKYTTAFTSGKSLSPHKLRHSFASEWLRSGGNLVLLRDQLGHSSIETTTLYTNLSDQDGQEFMDKIEHFRNNES
ncbi:tyrosine recombinase XerS [Pseudobacillus sp. 179-B 2D1 NHS]|uniref:tyrosine recombinase XerS n=1 Tax=Pseudobacillus sp. 179-B 2D1 NHS TaxID=3374292 RepID=UPI003879A43B